MNNKLRVGILGATGAVGQRFVTLLENHPYFEVKVLAASKNSEGKKYEDLMNSRWKLNKEIPNYAKEMIVEDLNNINKIKEKVDFVFCAVNMDKQETKLLEELYAKNEIPVVSNNSANRMEKDIPMVIPEINSEHFKIIEKQKERLNTKKGFIAVKPNCSIQSYVPLINALMEYEPQELVVSTYQAISGAGKNFNDWPEMVDNVIPFIKGEEEKSEIEPLKVWGSIENDEIVLTDKIKITSQCIRVPVTDGHLATIFVKFKNKPTKEQILEKWKNYQGEPQKLDLPMAPKQFITYFEEDDHPQTKLERDLDKGMAITAGRLREDNIYDYKFVGLSHNTVRGAAGGALLTAELLYKLGYLY